MRRDRDSLLSMLLAAEPIASAHSRLEKAGEAVVEGGGVTPEREAEIKRRIDDRFDDFSLNELRDATSSAMTFGIAFPESFTPQEREFAAKYFSQKIAELRGEVVGSEAED